MNTEAAFEGIQLENSILCKHNKIAGRVETVFCEADPIRLNDTSSLKRLGPGCCNECHQYNCTCLWEKHTHIKLNAKENKNNNNSNFPCSSQSRWTPCESSMLYRLKKRNLYCGNMNSKHMQCVMRPVPRMHFTESEENSTKTPTINPASVENDSSLKTAKNLLKPKPKIKFPKIANKEIFSSTKKYLDGNISHHINVEPTKELQSKSTLPTQKRATMSKNELSTQLDTNTPVAPVPVPAPLPIAAKLTKSPNINQCFTHKKHGTFHYDYAQHINDIISSRSLLANQKVYACHVPFPKDLYSKRMDTPPILSYMHGFNNTSIKRQSKVDEFLKDKQKEDSTVARSINSLENMQHNASVESKSLKEPSIKASKKNILWGAPSIIEQIQTDDKPIEKPTNTLNETSKICQKVLSIFNPAETECRFKIVKCDEKTFSSVAVQTDEIESNLTLTKPLTTNENTVQSGNLQNEIVERKKPIINEKKEQQIQMESNSFIESNKQGDIKKTKLESIGKDANKIVPNHNEHPVNSETSKNLTKVKRIAALFEAEILAHKNKAKAFDHIIHNNVRVQNDGSKNKLVKNSDELVHVFKTYSSSFQETNVAKSKDSGIVSDQAIPKAEEAIEKSSESFSDCSVVTVVLKKKKGQ